MPVLMWFRSDLRTSDNPALHHACRDSKGQVTAVFLACPAQWKAHDWGANKAGLVLRSVESLANRLHALGIPFRFQVTDPFADAGAALLSLAKQIKASALYFNAEYEVNEQRRDEDVAALFRKEGLETHRYEDQTVLPPTAVRKDDGAYYRVYTPYRKAWLTHATRHLPLRLLIAPAQRPPLPPVSLPLHDVLRQFGPASEEAQSLWPAGEEEAMRRLDRFVQQPIRAYKETRDRPAIEGTSTLSPYLACGAISARQCLAAALEANHGKLEGGLAGCDTWINELIWREFYRQILVGFPRVSMGRPFQLVTENIKWDNNTEHYERWKAGATGVPIVDAAMRQLRATGWMHNRLRMIVAMYLTKNLLTDWRWGERHFMNHLVDGDLASNNGGWQWAASTGTDAAPYFRVFNPVSQSRKFDPRGEFIRRYCPELSELDDDSIHDPGALPELYRARLNYPAMMVDLKASRQKAIDAFAGL